MACEPTDYTILILASPREPEAKALRPLSFLQDVQRQWGWQGLRPAGCAPGWSERQQDQLSALPAGVDGHPLLARHHSKRNPRQEAGANLGVAPLH